MSESSAYIFLHLLWNMGYHLKVVKVAYAVALRFSEEEISSGIKFFLKKADVGRPQFLS